MRYLILIAFIAFAAMYVLTLNRWADGIKVADPLPGYFQTKHLTELAGIYNGYWDGKQWIFKRRVK